MSKTHGNRSTEGARHYGRSCLLPCAEIASCIQALARFPEEKGFVGVESVDAERDQRVRVPALANQDALARTRDGSSVPLPTVAMLEGN